MLHTPTRCKGHLIVLLLVSFGSELVLLSVEMLVLPPLGLCKKQKQCFQTLRSLSATWGGAVPQFIHTLEHGVVMSPQYLPPKAQSESMMMLCQQAFSMDNPLGDMPQCTSRTAWHSSEISSL